MPLEDIESAGRYISDLISSNPVGATDFLDDADNHLRGIKNVLKLTFPNLDGAVTATPTELNVLDGITSNATELNILDGAIVTAAELNQLTGATGLALTESNTGIKSAGNITFNDNIRLRFGTGGVESHLYSDGTDTIWEFQSDKDLYLNDAATTRFWYDVSVGDFHADGDVIAFSTSVGSDPKLKKDITQIDDALVKVRQLTGVTYKWKKNDQPSAGLLSTAVEQVLPEAVTEVENMGDGGMYQSVNYNAVIGLLVEAVNALDAEVRTLKRRVNA